jgi:hypothetical protein
MAESSGTSFTAMPPKDFLRIAEQDWPKKLLKALQHPLKVQQHLSAGSKQYVDLVISTLK